MTALHAARKREARQEVQRKKEGSSLNTVAAASLIASRISLGQKFLGTVAEHEDGRQTQHISSALLRLGMGLDSKECHEGRRFLFAFPRFESARSCPPDLSAFVIADDPTYPDLSVKEYGENDYWGEGERIVVTRESHPPRGMSIEELCRVELVSEISGDAGSVARSYRARNADESICDVTVFQAKLRRTAICQRHQKNDDCEGAARVLCAIDYEKRYGKKQLASKGES